MTVTERILRFQHWCDTQAKAFAQNCTDPTLLAVVAEKLSAWPPSLDSQESLDTAEHILESVAAAIPALKWAGRKTRTEGLLLRFVRPKSSDYEEQRRAALRDARINGRSIPNSVSQAGSRILARLEALNIQPSPKDQL